MARKHKVAEGDGSDVQDKSKARKRGNTEGTIDQRPNGSWRGRIMIGYLPNGTADRRTVSGATRKEVQDKLRALRRSFCSLGQVALCEFPPKGEMFHVVGYPIDDIDYREKTVKIVKRGFGALFQEKEGEYFLLPFPKRFPPAGAGLAIRLLPHPRPDFGAGDVSHGARGPVRRVCLPATARPP